MGSPNRDDFPTENRSTADSACLRPIASTGWSRPLSARVERALNRAASRALSFNIPRSRPMSLHTGEHLHPITDYGTKHEGPTKRGVRSGRGAHGAWTVKASCCGQSV
jgi:hypothetical protein